MAHYTNKNPKPIESNAQSEMQNDSFRDSLSMQSLIVNSVKSAIMGKSGDNIQNLYDTFGYKLNISYRDYYNAYTRQDIAGRIIDAIVSITWKDFPMIVDDDVEYGETIQRNTSLRQYKQHMLRKRNNASALKQVRRANDEIGLLDESYATFTPFEEAIWELQARFSMLKIMKRADTLNCIGRFSIIVIGTKKEIGNDEDSRINDLKEELPQGTSIDDIAYLYTYSEGQVNISIWETDSTSPRYGMPKIYNIQVSGDGGTSINHQVHYSRVIHVAEDLLDSDVYGTPKLERVFNDLQDMLKIVGGSAEMFWLGAYQGLVFNVKDGYSLDEASRDAMTQEIENYTNKLQRFMKTKGVDVTTISSPTADPRGNFDVLIKLISGSSNVPERILLGAENGVYAGNTDQDSWHSHITSRRNSHADEGMIRPLINRLIEYGYIPQPNGGDYFVKWPQLFDASTTEKLTNAQTLINAAKAATSFGNTLEIITKEEVRASLGLDPNMPETSYSEFTDEGDALIEEDLTNLPNEDDTEDLPNMTALELYRARKSRISN